MYNFLEGTNPRHVLEYTIKRRLEKDMTQRLLLYCTLVAPHFLHLIVRRYVTRIVLREARIKYFEKTRAMYDASCAVELFAPLTVVKAMCIR